MIGVENHSKKPILNLPGIKESLSSQSSDNQTSVETVYRIISSKPILRDDPEVRAAYLSFILRKEVYGSDLKVLDTDVRSFLEALSPEERESLKNYLLSLDSPFIHYLVFEEAGKRLSVASQTKPHLRDKRDKDFDLYDGYLFCLSAVSRVFRRTYDPKDPLTYSLLCADFVLIFTLLDLPPDKLAHAYSELSFSMEGIGEELKGRILFPLDMEKYLEQIQSSSSEEVQIGKSWNLVGLPYFKNLAPMLKGDPPNFIREAIDKIFEMKKLP